MTEIASLPDQPSNISYVTEADLPLSCPSSDTPTWKAHPRVFLPIAENKPVSCPYCSRQFVWTSSAPDRD